MWLRDRAGELYHAARWCLATSSLQLWGSCQLNGSESIHRMLCWCHSCRLQRTCGSLSFCLSLNLNFSLKILWAFQEVTRSKCNRLCRARILIKMVNRPQRVRNRKIESYFIVARNGLYLKAKKLRWLKLLCRKLMMIWGTIGEVLRGHLKGVWLRAFLGMMHCSNNTKKRSCKWENSWLNRYKTSMIIL